MRVRLDLPKELLDEARKTAGLTSNSETVVFALEQLVRREKRGHLKGLLGSVEIHMDLDRSRRRPATP